ncbi:hypothetical protein ACHAWO_001456 [Cyclotella atomus]|uniref:Uncharacterized protein n=1 Tax=Cyclotella atomus TaxID=382360 RepID=A0ABD3PCV0_9STRA
MIPPTIPPPTRPLSTIAILRFLLPIAIFLLSIAPILFHDVSIHQIHSLDDKLLRSHSKHRKSVEYYFNETELFGTHSSSLARSNITFPPDIGTAGKSLLLHALTPRSIPDEAFNPIYEQQRCVKYFSYENYNKSFLSYDPTILHKRRRLFLGSLIADDSWHALGALAMESYGIYEAVVFVESNRTQTGTPRKLRFVKGSEDYEMLVNQQLFGPNTKVLLDYYSYEGEIDGGGLIREHRQRALILELWKGAGMTVDDVGILSDADETPTRDFLRALQSCNFPELNLDQDCWSPKIVVASNVFEGSPECMTVTRKWMHPDVILGKCIEGIGSKEYQLTVEQRQRAYAWRKDEYSAKFNYSSWPKSKRQYPLWNPADFRRDTGGFVIYYEDVDYLPFRMGHTGFHFHNYFETTHQLRTKYRTYGHPVKSADNMSVSEIHPDLDLMADCVLGRPLEKNKHSTLSTRLAKFEGRIPIAYRLKGYSVARHLELRYILSEDERTWTAGTWHETEKGKEAESKKT